MLTNIQASLVHLGLSAVMGTSCLVNKQACKHKLYGALHTGLFTGLLESEIIRIDAEKQDITVCRFTGYSGVCFSEVLPQIS